MKVLSNLKAGQSEDTTGGQFNEPGGQILDPYEEERRRRRVEAITITQKVPEIPMGE